MSASSASVCCPCVPGCIVWGEHASCALWPTRRHTARRCYSPRRWTDHPHSQALLLCLRVDSKATSHGAHLPCWNPGLTGCCSVIVILNHCCLVGSGPEICENAVGCTAQGCFLIFSVWTRSGRGYRGSVPTAVQAWQPRPLWEPSPGHPPYY